MGNNHWTRGAWAVVVSMWCVGAGLTHAQDAAGPVDYASLTGRIDQIADEELDRGILRGFSIALVDDQRVVFAKGYGLADVKRSVPAAKDTIYRAGSISKLFNAVMVMQLAEQGKLDIDRPIREYDITPPFRIVNPYDKQVTLRQLMCHRSGLIRESPTGSYFDPDEPSLEQTVASIAPCVMVYPPDTKTKYSNIGVAVAGHVASQLAGVPFNEYQHRHILDPLGMSSSSFLMNDKLRPRLSKGYMIVAKPKQRYDSDELPRFDVIEAPEFELGTIPAGNLYTTAEDLAKFVMMLFAEGKAGDGTEIVKPDTLNQMFTPQLTGESRGFGLGFAVGAYRDLKTVSHSGAVYGFSTSMVALPQQKIGVIVLSNEDIASGAVGKVSNALLDLMLSAKLGMEPTPVPAELPLDAAALQGFTGDYESESYWAKLVVEDGKLVAHVSGQVLPLTARGPVSFAANGRFANNGPFEFERGADGTVTGFTGLGQQFARVDPAKIPPIPESWKGLIGSYGPSFIPFIVSVRHGHLYAMTENMVDYRMYPVNQTVFNMSPGLYTDEQCVFEVDGSGKAQAAVLANMRLPLLKPWSLIPAGNAWAIWAVILAAVAMSIFMEQRYNWAAKISGPVIALLLAMTLTNLKIMPTDSPAYGLIWDYLIYAAIPLLLFKANLVTIARTTGWMFVAFHIAAVGTILGAIVATMIFRGPLEGVAPVAEVAAIMTGSYIGGAVNFLAIKSSYGVDENITNPLLVADNFIMAGMFVLLLMIVASKTFRRFYPHPHSKQEDVESSRSLAAEHWKRKEIGLLDIAKALAVSVGIVAVCHAASAAIKTAIPVGFVADVLANRFVLITFASVILATLLHRSMMRIHGADELGGYMLFIFLFAIGLPADLWQVVTNIPLLFLFCLVMAVVNLVVTLTLGKLMKLNLEELALCVNATLGGPPSAAAMAIAKGWQRLVLPSILVGIWGYVIGTPLGLLVGHLLKGG